MKRITIFERVGRTTSIRNELQQEVNEYLAKPVPPEYARCETSIRLSTAVQVNGAFVITIVVFEEFLFE